MTRIYHVMLLCKSTDESHDHWPLQEFKCPERECDYRAMRHADVELHRRAVHRAASTAGVHTAATFVVSAGGRGVHRLPHLETTAVVAASAPAGNSKPRNSVVGKPRKFLCVMCDASFLQKAHLVSNIWLVLQSWYL